jgi:F-type H+-transporting ATPase subunit delta
MATSTRIAQRYATAIMSIANDNNTTENIRKDFTLIVDSLNASDELRALFNSPVVKYLHKISICKEVFEGKVSTLMIQFLEMLAEKRRESVFPEISAAFTELYNQQNNLVPVQVVSAIELSAELSASLIKAIAEKTGKTVLPEFSVDPAIKGGLIITIADTMIDASVRHQLNKLQVELSGSYSVTM